MVNSQEAIDISVDSVSVPSGPATLGDTVTITVTVGNSTSSAAASVDVVLNALPSGGNPVNVGTLNVSVGAESTTDVSFNWDTADAQPGNYTFQAVALLDGTGDDGDQSNNFKLTTTPLSIVSPPAKDVAVTDVDVPDGPVTQGDQVSVTVTVDNLGTDPASSVSVTLLDTLDMKLADQKTVASIAVGDSSDVTLSWDTSSASVGDHTLKAAAILEGDENNGNDSLDADTPITVKARPAKDVAVTDVDVPDGPVTQGDQVSVTVTVDNLGTDPASSVSVTLLDTLDMKLADQKTVASIAVGDSSDVTLSWDTSSASVGDHTLKAAAILEGDENNGNDSLDADSPITVKTRPAKDVAVTEVSLPSASIGEGDIVDVEVTVENKGTETVSVTLAVVDTQGLTQIVERNIDELASGESVAETVPWDSSGATVGEHKVQASATVEGEETAQLGDNFLVSETSIAIVSYRLTLGDGNGGNLPLATFHRRMVAPSVETVPEPLGEILAFGSGAQAEYTFSPTVITSSLAPLESLFAANSQATFGSGFSLQNPFELGHIRGVIRLEERESSTGAHVIVGGQTFFAREDGAFDATVPMGNYDVEMRAPGYVSVRITGIRLGIGGEVTIPGLTLPFGDANGDGRIDIFDLSIAAGNFGATAKRYSLP